MNATVDNEAHCPDCGAHYSEPHRDDCAGMLRRRADYEAIKRRQAEERARTAIGQIEKQGFKTPFRVEEWYPERSESVYVVLDASGQEIVRSDVEEYSRLIVTALNEAVSREDD